MVQGLTDLVSSAAVSGSTAWPMRHVVAGWSCFCRLVACIRRTNTSAVAIETATAEV